MVRARIAFLNVTRVALGTSCHVGGTGFMFSRRIMERNDGWKFHLLTEDMEFSMDCILHGDRIGFADLLCFSMNSLLTSKPVGRNACAGRKVIWKFSVTTGKL